MSSQTNQLGSRGMNARRPVNGQVVSQPVSTQQRTAPQQGTGAMVPAAMNSRMSTATKPAAATVKPATQAKPATANTANSTNPANKKTTNTTTTNSR